MTSVELIKELDGTNNVMMFIWSLNRGAKTARFVLRVALEVVESLKSKNKVDN